MTTPPLARRLDGVASSTVRDVLRLAQQPDMLSLAGGLPDPALLDLDGLTAATQHVLRTQPERVFQYGSTEGQPALREQLARLMQSRGADVPAGRILVTGGSQQALDLVARTLLDPGDVVAVEDPCYLAALQVFGLAETRLLPLPVDNDGARIEDLVSGRLPVPKLVYLVPAFGNPSGAVLSLERRRALLLWAVRHGVWLLEDDPYGELRYEGVPVPSLLALAPEIPGASERLLHVSSLSKIGAPGARIGWLVAPSALLPGLVRTKQALDLQTGTLTQEIAAAWLAADRLPTALTRLRGGYRQRRNALVAALQHRFGDRLSFGVPAGGMFLWARFRDGRSTTVLLEYAAESGVIFVPGQAFSAGAPRQDSMRLGFASLPPEKFGAAAERLLHACNWQDRGGRFFPKAL